MYLGNPSEGSRAWYERYVHVRFQPLYRHASIYSSEPHGKAAEQSAQNTFRSLHSCLTPFSAMPLMVCRKPTGRQQSIARRPLFPVILENYVQHYFQNVLRGLTAVSGHCLFYHYSRKPARRQKGRRQQCKVSRPQITLSLFRSVGLFAFSDSWHRRVRDELLYWELQ